MDQRNRGEIARRAAEAIVIAMACLAPWAFGSVEAWAQLGLYVGITIVTVLVAIADGTNSRLRRLLCLPSLGLGGLVFLALFQITPLPVGVVRWIAPGMATLRAGLLPHAPEQVVGDQEPIVPLPAPRLSQDPDATLQTASQLAASWLLFQVVLGLGPGSTVLRRLAVACTLNATLLSLFSIVQSLTWNGRIYWLRATPTTAKWAGGGPFVCHTHLAESLNMGLGFAIGLLMPGGWRDLLRGKTYRLWAGYAAVVIVAGVVTSSSRGGFLAMIAAGIILAVLLRKQAYRIGIGIGLLVLLVLVIFVLAAVGDSSPYLQRIATVVDSSEGGYHIRFEIWRAAVRAWWDSPTWGTGLGTFPEATASYLEHDRGTFFSRAENEYVDLLCEGGLAGIALLVTFAVGVVRLSRRALLAAQEPRDRGLIFGAIFGVLALGLNSLSDFGPHIPGVGMMALILIGSLCRMGLAADPVKEEASSSVPARMGSVAGALGTIALGMVLIAHGVTNARVEAKLNAVDLPLPELSIPAMNDFASTRPELERQKVALEEVLRLRPDWTDGHIRLGMLHLILYEKLAAEWLRDSGQADRGRAANPLWLFRVVHDPNRRGSAPISGEDLLEYDPVRLHLVPAARSFLQARRSCLVSPMPHAELASLDYLLTGGDSASSYVTRALRLAGTSGDTLEFSAEVAAGVGDTKLAARCWNKTLRVGRGGWAEVADSTAEVLTADQILEDVVPNGQLALQFADRLYPEAENRVNRQRFLRAAVRMLPMEIDLSPANRLQLEARAWAGLEQATEAKERMEAALALEPQHDEWRKDLIDWLLRWERFDDAHDQARVWVYFAPESKAARETLDSTAETLARHGRK